MRARVSMRLAGAVLAFAFGGLACAGQAFAGEFGVSELRGGVLAYDVYPGFIPSNPASWNLSNVEAVKFSVLFTSPDLDAFRWLGAPRPEIGTTINVVGKPSILHANLDWKVQPFEAPVFVDLAFGAAIHNGPLNWFGCRVGFYERAGVGVDITDTASLILAYEHTSNGDLCPPNKGLSNFGLTLAVNID